MNSAFYPEVYRGCEIEWASEPNAPDSRWRLGEVTALKNDSCDVKICMEFGFETRHDCIHIDDPRCFRARDWAAPDRGIFRLSQSEVRRREILDRMDRIEAKLAAPSSDLATRLEVLEAQVAEMFNPSPRRQKVSA